VVLGVTLASAVAPTVTIEDASEVACTTATVKGSVDPHGQPTTYRFQYIGEAQFQENLANLLPGFEGATTGIEEFTETAETLERELSGLAPGTVYHLRLQAENGEGPEEAVAADTFTTKAVTRATVTLDPITTFTGTTAHFSGTINPNAPAGNPAAFDVNWRFECNPECPDVESGEIAADGASHPVSVIAGGLQANTVYEVRLIAANTGGEEVAGPESFRTEAVGPAISTMPAFALEGGTEALVGGKINPENSPTTYWIEYGTDQNHGGRTPASGGLEVGSGGEPIVVSQKIAGLKAQTEYHFRVVAENSRGVIPGGDVTFVTAAAKGSSQPSCPANQALREQQHANSLPDCRAWEMVSPVAKGGVPVESASALLNAGNNVSSVDGDKVLFSSPGAFPGDPSSDGLVPHLGTRNAQGWSTTPVMPLTTPLASQGAFGSAGVQGASSDLSAIVLKSFDPPLTPGAPPSVKNLYRSDLTANGAYKLLTPSAPSEPTNTLYNPRFAAASVDFSAILFESSASLVVGAPEFALELPQKANLYEWKNGVLSLVGVLPGPAGGPALEGSYAGPGPVGQNPGGATGSNYTETAISRDGSRIFWTDGASGQIYLRENGMTTAQVSASQRGVPDPPQRAIFRAATPDGSAVFFTSPAKLTEDSTANGREDLYKYEVGGGELTDLSVDPVPTDTHGADVLGLVGASEDGEFVYFAATGDLASGATTGDLNVYLWHGGEVSDVADLGPAEGPLAIRESRNWALTPTGAPNTSRVSADGQVLTLTSLQQLTAFDNAGFSEIYRYDVAEEALDCVTCNPRVGRASSEGNVLAENPDTSTEFSPFPTRTLSSDGSRVFFATAEAMLPSDTNGQVDVYEWNDGAVQLISSGQSSTGSYFAEASPSGEDVFFVTRQRLVEIDSDNLADLYDARVNGGIAAQDPGLAPPACSGLACRGPAAQQSAAATPGSAAFQGPSSSKPQGPKKHHKKKHHKKKHHKKPSHGHGRPDANRGGSK
jgi:hypothetical protein